MNGVPPTGLSNGASRSEATKFFSQSENDVAAAFAELLKYEGISPASEPGPTPPPPATGSQSSSSRSSTSTSSESTASSAPSAAPAPKTASAEQSDERRDREDEEDDRVAGVAQPVPTQQQTQSAADTDSDNAASPEEAELEALLAEARTAQQELEAAGSKQGKEASSEATASTSKSATDFDEELRAAAEATGAETAAAAVEPTSEASPQVTVPADTTILDPLRRADASDEESDPESGFAIEDAANEGGVDEAALAELVAKAASAAENRKDGRSGDRSGKRESDLAEKSDAAAGVEAASQAASADRAADASAAVVASVVTSENATSATKSDAASVDAAGAPSSAGIAGRQETTGSLQRSIERPAEADRRPLSGADRSRFFDRVERAFKSAEQGDGSIRMRLHPAELGSMQLTLERSETGEWIARIETENQDAKQTLLDHAGALKERLADQDFRLARLEVETPADRRQQEARDFQENPQSFSRHRDRRDDEKTGEERAGESAPTSAAPGDRSRRLDVTI